MRRELLPRKKNYAHKFQKLEKHANSSPDQRFIKHF